MRKPASFISVSRRKFIYFIVLLISLVSVTPVLAEYIGPQRTVTETINACKIVLLECQFVSSKNDYLYHKINEWSCSNESRPWRDYPSEPPRSCSSQALGEEYWERDEIPRQVTTTYPPATISGTLQNCTLNNGWCVTAPHLSLIGSEPVAGYSILAIEGTRNGQTFACSGSSCNLPLVEGVNNLTFWAFSSFTDTSLMGTWSGKVDTQQPTITGSLTGTAGSNGWYTGPVTLNGAASDPTSGLASFTCTLDGSPLPSCATILVNGDGMHTLSLTARDQAGNVRTLTQNASIDSQNPILAASISGTRGSNDWYTEAALNASASDPAPGSGLSVIEYNLDNSSWTPFPSTGTLTLPEGNHTIDLRAVDQAGLTATSSRSFLLDRAIPSIAIHASGTLGTESWYTTPLSISASAADEISGMAVFEYSLDNDVWTAYSGPLYLEDGIHTLSFWAEDQAGLGTQEDRNYKVDSRPPQIAGSISGVPGENGWFISNVTLSASASDPLPGSGMDTFTYILNEDAETSYSDALNLSDGQHAVQLQARDKAGLIYSQEESVKVDTLLPSLQVDTALPAWVKDTVTLSGTASDEGSGLSSVDISLDGGRTWQALESADSWSYIWDTLNSSNGMQEILLRARDHAGLVFQQSLKTGVDNRPPSVNLPVTWFQWDTVTLDVWDDDSGLAEALVEISDPEGRWPSRVIPLNESQFPLKFTWDRRFGDGTKAPAGTYDLKLTATDQLGHSTIGTSSIKVLLTILPPGATSTPQPPARPTSTPTATFIPTASPTIVSTQTSVVWTFGATSEPDLLATPTPGTVPTLRATPTQNSVEEWFESVFGSVPGASENTIEIGTLGETAPNATPQESGALWGAAAAAMMGAMTSYALDEKRKQEEEKAQRALQEAEEEERREKARARKMEKLEEQWVQERLWEQARLDKEARTQARLDEQLLRRGPEAEEGAKWMASQAAILQKEEEKRLIEERWIESRTQANLLRQEAEDGAKWFASQAELEETYLQHKAPEWQEGLAAYYNARKQGETEASQVTPNYWEKVKSLANEHLIQPFNEKVYQPIIKPAMEWRQQLVEYRNQLVDKYIYQPIVKPAYEGLKQVSSAIGTWIDERLQPHVGPFLTRTGELISEDISWLYDKVYQPYIKPALEETKQFVIEEAAWINENIYQPYVQPVVEKINEKIYQPFIQPAIDRRIEQLRDGISWVNENIYQPLYAPMFKDIHQYILKPLMKEAKEWWEDYGEWVHGALDVVGLIPGAGEIADGINGLIYLAEGRKLEATLSLISAVPVLGYFGQAGKSVLKVGETAVNVAVGTVAKGVFGNVIQKAAKESIEQAAEKTATKSGDWIHNALEVMGCIPGVGNATTSLNGLVQLGKGRFVDAGFSAVSMVPVVGDVAITGKKIVDESLKRLIKEAAEELREKALKEGSTEIFEKTVKESGEELAEKVTKESLEQGSEKIFKEAGEAVAEKNTQQVFSESVEKTISKVQKEIREDAFIENLSEENKPETTASVVQSLVTEQAVDNTAKQIGKETAQRVLKKAEAGKVVKLPADIADGLSKEDAELLATKISEELNGKRVWISAEQGTVYISNPPSEGFILVQQLKQTDLTKKDEVRKILREIAKLTSRGSGKNVVLGPFGKKGDFIQAALETNSIFWDVGDDLWTAVQDSGIDMFELNDQFLQVQIERGVDRFDFINTNVSEIIDVINNSPPKDWKDVKYTHKEILDLSTMPDIPYQLVDNSWIRTDLVHKIK